MDLANTPFGLIPLICTNTPNSGANSQLFIHTYCLRANPPPPRTFTRAHALLRDGRCRGSPDAVEHDDVLCARWGGVRALARGLCARFSERLKVSTEKWLE